MQNVQRYRENKDNVYKVKDKHKSISNYEIDGIIS